MKYYIYISDTKLDMLAAQIPKGILGRIAAELSINVNVASITLKTNPSDETRYSKLALVSHYIEKSEPVGDIDNPKAFVGAKAEMAWSVIESGVVCFAGRTQHTDCVLVGSSTHVLGSRGTPLEISPSFDPYPSLQRVAEAMNPQRQDSGFENDIDFTMEWVRRERPEQKLEFMARRLTSWTNSDGRTSVLGSPIYVASADQ